MGQSEGILIWVWRGLRYGLPLSRVQRVVAMAEIRPVPNPPPRLLGLLDVQGEVILVFHLGEEGFVPEPLRVNQQLILAQSAQGRLGLVSDEVIGLLDSSAEELVPYKKALPGAKGIQAVFKSSNGLVLTPDLEMLITAQPLELPKLAKPERAV